MKRIAQFLISLLIFMMSSCGPKSEEKVPADVIPREQMIDIMVDAWFMESVIHNSIKDYEKLNAVSVTMYAKFFEDHGISKEQFTHSIEYYMRDEETSEAFIQDCSKRFDERKEELTGVADPVLQPQ